MTEDQNNSEKAKKIQVSAQQGIMAFPGFPVVLVCVKKNILTVAAVSFFSFKPPTVMVGIVPKRYSFKLIEETGDYSINMPTLELLETVKFCGSKSGRDVDKFEATGLTPKRGQKISSYLIDECPVSLECKVIHTIDLKGTHVWFVGEVVAAHQREDYDRSQALLYWPREFRNVGEVIEK